MKLVKVIKNGSVVQPVKFDNDADMNQWIQMLADTAAWGLPERWLVDSPMSPLSEEQKAMALETRTVEVMGEQVVEYKLGAEYEVVIENISAQVEQERINQEALAYLASTDWMVIRESEGGTVCPVEVKQARSAARNRIVK